MVHPERRNVAMEFEPARDQIMASIPLSGIGLVVFQPTVKPNLGRSVVIFKPVVAKAARLKC
jgi:hypothetical protein